MQRKVRGGRVMLTMLLLIGLACWFRAASAGRQRDLPAGISCAGLVRTVADLRFHHDLTYTKDGQVVREQTIFARIFQIIEQAERFLVVDMFLFNSEYDRALRFPPLADRLTDALIAKKVKEPGMKIIVISDEINTHYGTTLPPQFIKLKAHGIDVIITDTTMLRDSNSFYSSLWRPFVKPFGGGGNGWLPSPFSPDGPKMTLRSYLRLMNFKANHRKVVASEKNALIASGNAHDASGFHSNIAFSVDGGVVNDVVRSEEAVAVMSGRSLDVPQEPVAPADGAIKVQLLTEGKIKSRILAALAGCGRGGAVRMAMFYLADQDVLQALAGAAARGAEVRLVLDPNKDAFGRKKNGIPNRPMAEQLRKKSGGGVKIRWYATHGEQFHSKLTMISMPDKTVIIGGSANLTRRNIDDYNLESCLAVYAPSQSRIAGEVRDYFERIWENRDGEYTVEYSAYQSRSLVQYLAYRFQEWSGMGTF